MPSIYQPVKPFVISQHFGENRACVSLDGKNTVISCDGAHPPSGYRALYGAGGHGGLDLRATHGQEVFACATGTVYSIDTQPRSGLDVRIESEENGVRFRHIYEHLLGYQPKIGDYIRVGQLIGWADNTGYSSGDHLHFQLEVWNGSTWVKTDPLKYMENTFAPDILKLQNKILYLKSVVAQLMERMAYKLRK